MGPSTRWPLALVFVGACSFAPGVLPGDDAPGGTEGIGTTDARACFGSGLVTVCFATVPTDPLVLPGVANPLDTGDDNNCHLVVAQQGGPALCVLAGTTVDVTGALVAIGARPLVLVGTSALTVTGSVDVSSKSDPARTGAGADLAMCPPAGIGTNDRGGGGGGAGGSFGTAGGTGGTGDTNSNGPPVGAAPGGNAASAQTPLVLRGGCPGGTGGEGGDSDGVNPGGAGGPGGGAVSLIAGTSIAIAGDVFASGAGGRVTKGNTSLCAPGNGGFEQGGGGGGSGGMIAIDAPAILIDGRIAANGGGGAGGGGCFGGDFGGNGTTVNWNVRANGGVGDNATGNGGGNGAPGTAIAMTTGLDAASATAGAGGGGGGLGVVWIDGTVSGGTMMSPAPTPH